MKSAFAWILQRVTGVLLVAGLLIHFLIMHFSGPGQITYRFVAARLNSPFWRTFDLLFLLSVIYHGFNGIWGIALEYARPGKLLIALQAVILISALGLAGTGIYILTP